MHAIQSGTKVSSLMKDPGRSAWSKYRRMFYGELPVMKVLHAEIAVMLFSSMGGGLGLLLRSRAYHSLMAAAGKNTVFGRNCTFRHPGKIRIGDNGIIDENCLIDAKGEDNAGIVLGHDVYIGRHTAIYCKNGDITVGDRVNISSSCTIMSANRLHIGEDTVIGAYTYLLSGGEYDYTSETPFSGQTGMDSRGPLSIGHNCWLGARVTVLDGVCIGNHCVIGAGAVVTRSIPDNSLAVGTPAKVIKTIPPAS